MHFEGLMIGLISFVLTFLFEPIIVKGEYYFSSKIWPVFLLCGVFFLISALAITNVVLSSFFGILGFTCFTSIGALKVQEERVNRGLAPKNMKRKKRR